MKKKILVSSVVAVALVAVFLVVFGFIKNAQKEDKFEVKSGETFTVKVSMADSGPLKSMALSLFFDENEFELIEGEWLNQNAIIADFNMKNKDAAIAFEKETTYCGEIFEFSVKSKSDMVIMDDMFIVEPVLKNGQRFLECKGITVSFEKEKD